MYQIPNALTQILEHLAFEVLKFLCCFVELQPLDLEIESLVLTFGFVLPIFVEIIPR